MSELASSSSSNPVVLIVAKMPVPGQAKTRLAAAVGSAVAAELAAATLLDTLDAVSAANVPAMVACAGDLGQAVRRREIAEALAHFPVVRQRGRTFGERLAAAHWSAGRSGRPVFQIGTDTPQLEAQLLLDGLAVLSSHDAVLGPATDGGWWALGVSRAELAGPLIDVPMSHPDTGARTAAMLRAQGVRVGALAELTDVDTLEDAIEVAGHPSCGRRFRHVFADRRAVVP